METKRTKLIKARKNPYCEGEEVTIMDLPNVLMVDIFSRLPLKSIFRCMCVCKIWYTLLSDPSFASAHHTRSSPFTCLLLSDSDGFVSSIFELNADDDYDGYLSNRPITLFPTFNFGLGFIKPKLKLICSCNGFLCLLNGNMIDRSHSLYISNPILGDYFEIRLPDREIGVRPVAYGFCFCEASGNYKVLRLVCKRRENDTKETELEVCTLGVKMNRKWRNVGKAPRPLQESFGDVTVNGSLHWIHNENLEGNATIYSFDISAEKVKTVPAPPGLKTKYVHLTVLRNCLYLTESILGPRHYVAIWKMKEYGISESWTKCYHFRTTRNDICKSIVIWKDGEFLMQNVSRSYLFSYNPKEKQDKNHRIVSVAVRAVARYVPSFYSLNTIVRSFGVLNVRTKT